VEIMHNNTMRKMILNAKMDSGRRRGRSGKWWFDDVECDIKRLGIINWRLKARSRLEWRTVVREVKVHFNTGL
jgi:hypothetical protein